MERGVFIAALLISVTCSVMLIARCAMRSHRIALIGAALDAFEISSFGVVLGGATVASSPPSHRLQNMTSRFATLTAASQQMNIGAFGSFYLPMQAMLAYGRWLQPWCCCSSRSARWPRAY